MALAALRGQLASQCDAIVKGAPARCETLLKTRQAVEASRPAAESLEIPQPIQQAFDLLDAEVHAVSRDLRDIGAYIRLHVPVHEDGNNFYVDMQEGIAKLCDDAASKVAELADVRVTYLEKRADIKEKISPSV